MKNYYNCIYLYINKINNRKYVGQAKNFNKRHADHIKKSANKYPIDKAFNKYGKENFEIIILKENLSTQCLMNFWECYYIDKYNCLSKENYNIASGGDGGHNNFAGKIVEEMEEIRRKMSDAHKGEKNHNYGKQMSEVQKQKISESMKGKMTGENHPFYGKHHTEETKRKIGETNKGKECYWKTHEISQETKQKMSENHADVNGENNPMYGKKHKEESKQKISNANKGENHPQIRKIAQYDKQMNLIKIWSYAKQIEDELGIYSTSITRCCKFWELNCDKNEWFKTHKNKPIKSSGGFIWKYA